MRQNTTFVPYNDEFDDKHTEILNSHIQSELAQQLAYYKHYIPVTT